MILNVYINAFLLLSLFKLQKSLREALVYLDVESQGSIKLIKFRAYFITYYSL